MSSFIFYTPHQILLRRSTEEEWNGRGVWHVWGKDRYVQGFGGETCGEKTTWKT